MGGRWGVGAPFQSRDPSQVAYLNHGGYGASLRCAMDAQSYYRHRVEAAPIRFMEEEALPGLGALRSLWDRCRESYDVSGGRRAQWRLSRTWPDSCTPSRRTWPWYRTPQLVSTPCFAPRRSLKETRC